MRIEGECLDEILIRSYDLIERHGHANVGTRGSNKEVIGASLLLRNPRARLSRSSDRGVPLSAVGEFLWYLSGSDDIEFITAYIPKYEKEVGENGRINGAYGPRLFSSYGLNQFDAVADLIGRKAKTRRAVLQIYSARDLETDDEVPCTTTLQFLNREGRLHLVASLRSNDAYLGLPHDVFCFTMIQEMMANRLGLELGEYTQLIGSFHLYDSAREKAARYEREGYHRVQEMSRMPEGDPFEEIPRILAAESSVRLGEDAADLAVAGLPDYWGDVLRLAQARLAVEVERLREIRACLKDTEYEAYIDDRIDLLVKRAAKAEASKAT